MKKHWVGVAALALWAGACAAPETPTPNPTPKAEAPRAPAVLAPAPRAVADTRVHRKHFEGFVHAADTKEEYELLGVTWRVNVEVRRLVTTGRDVIDFKWSMKYTGRRPPLIIRKPSLIESLPGDTEVHFYAFAPGQERGRKIVFTAPEMDDESFARFLRDGTPASWWLEVKKGKTESGTESVFVADLKERLRALYPTEFPADKPPKLYVEFIHNARDRGWGALDAWTGELGVQFKLEVPDLKSW